MSKEIQSLIEGYHAFREQYFNTDQGELYETLAREGQRPKVLMIACSDSRVDPAIVTRCQPGDLFVIRNVANLVPPYEQDSEHYHGTSAALEFGICGLGIRNIIVCGHSQCGGIRSLWKGYQNASSNSFMEKWMQLAKPVYDKVYLEMAGEAKENVEAYMECCAKQSLIHSLQHLESFPWIAEKMQSGNLFLHAWYFDLLKGFIERFNSEKGVYEDLEKK